MYKESEEEGDVEKKKKKNDVEKKLGMRIGTRRSPSSECFCAYDMNSAHATITDRVSFFSFFFFSLMKKNF